MAPPARELLARDATRILAFGTRLAQLSGAYQGMNQWWRGRRIWTDQEFLLRASMQALSHSAASMCVSLMDDDSDSSDVNFRRIRQAMADEAFTERLVHEEAARWTMGVAIEQRSERYASYEQKLNSHTRQLSQILLDWGTSGDKLKELKRFRNKRISHTTTSDAQTTNGVVWKAETAVLRAATLANVIFAGGGVDLEDDRSIARETALSALDRFGAVRTDMGGP